MSNLKCPFCQQELEYLSEDRYGNMWCNNCYVKNNKSYAGSKEQWQELIRTRKALDVAVDALKWICETYNLGMGYEAAIMEKCEYALEQITALEQKD